MKKGLIISSIFITLLVLVSIVACAQPAPSPSPTPTATAKPTASPTPTATPTASPTPTATAKPVTLKWSLWVAETDFRAKAQQYYADLVNQRSGGRLTLKIFAGESLAKAAAELDMLGAGNIDMATLTYVYVIGKMPVLDWANLPLGPRADQLDGLLTKLAPLYIETLAKENIRPLFGGYSGRQQVFHRSKFLKAPADWKGEKMRMPGGYQSRFAEVLGAGVVSVTASEQYMALQTGTVNGTATTPNTYLSYKLYEVAPYATIINWLVPSMATSINLGVWKSLPADLQKIMLDAAPEAQKNEIALAMAFDKEANAKLTAAGAKLYEATDEERNAYAKAAAPLYDEFAAKGPQFKTVVDMLRELQK